jgi:hypothetical protein
MLRHSEGYLSYLFMTTNAAAYITIEQIGIIDVVRPHKTVRLKLNSQERPLPVWGFS